jgi:hypothetical protein
MSPLTPSSTLHLDPRATQPAEALADKWAMLSFQRLEVYQRSIELLALALEISRAPHQARTPRQGCQTLCSTRFDDAPRGAAALQATSCVPRRAERGGGMGRVSVRRSRQRRHASRSCSGPHPGRNDIGHRCSTDPRRRAVSRPARSRRGKLDGLARRAADTWPEARNPA